MAEGRIADIEPLPGTAPGPRRLAMPALVNAHDHARTFRSATLGAAEQPLETWLAWLGVLPGVDPWLCAATSFARSARKGAARVMVHYTRVQGGMPYADEALAVARAARDVGIRIGLAAAIRDRQGIGYADDDTVLAALRPNIRGAVRERLSVRAEPPAAHLARVDELATAVDEAGLAGQVSVQYGPTAVQWCSPALLVAVAQASADTGRGVHMHLLETRYQREWADRVHPEGIVRMLDAIGLLSPRLTLAHCAWARPEELALLAERGVTIAVNTASNLGLRSGIAPVAEMLRQGCRVAMGLDGMAFDEDDDGLRELRLAWALHRGWGFEEAMSRAQLWDFALRHGRRSVDGPLPASAADDAASGPLLAPGRPADVLVLDWESLDDDSLFDDVDPLDLLMARAHGGHVRDLFVAGRAVVAEGRVTGIDEPTLRAELLARTRSALAADPRAAAWRATLREMAEDLGPFYRRGGPGCC
ncbi:MAG: amidohydrolase family protein [Betaproteobacteria bacterium]|nr:amidohydrolase family protein [Betaproteobacteria bacterium]